MRRPLAVFVALRYLRSGRGSGFVSFVNAASVLGVALGVATLIVVLSVMNGFENELRSRLLGLTAHAAVVPSGSGDPLPDWQPLVAGLEAQPDIVAAAPFVEIEGMLTGPGGMTAALITGVEPAYEREVSAVATSMVLGSLDDLRGGEQMIILGRSLSATLGVGLGDTVSLLVPVPSPEGRMPTSRLTAFTVSGIFELGVQEHDGIRALVHLNDASPLAGNNQAARGIRLETRDIFAAPQIARAAVANLDNPGLAVRDWTQENESYFRAIRIEKLMMALLLSLIIAVAAFNIVATLVMVVTEKRGGIAILRTLGCSPRDVVTVFVLQGTALGWAGALTGVALGVWLSLNVATVAPALESVFGFQFMPADLYYLTALPAELQSGDVLWAALGVLFLTAVATIYPALRAAAVDPADVLRYE
ncbi:MAG: lipoprotein-releasing ABC transporter permease subunit [Gammaproteobacteria bacterium]|nr:lipoprotein-releasing ABC transporter permease subunit [Gammaproteobacteria bacterium]